MHSSRKTDLLTEVFEETDLQEESTPQVRRRRAAGPSSRQLRVLIVEDDDDLRAAVREVFFMYGYLVSTAADGFAAVEAAAQSPCDVIVSDVRLPGLDGLAVSRSARTLDRPPKVILMTAYPDWKVYFDAIDSGAYAIVSKPVTLAKLAEMVRQAADDDTDPSRPFGGEAQSN